MVPFDEHHFSFSTNSTILDNERLTNMYSKLNNTKTKRKNKLTDQVQSTFNADFSLYEHPILTELSTKTINSTQKNYLSGTSISQTTTSIQPMPHFSHPYVQDHDLRLNFLGASSAYTPFCPPDSMPALSTPQICTYEVNSVQSTPFLTPKVEFDRGSFDSNLQPQTTQHQSSLDFSLYCKDGSFHVDEELCEDRQSALIAPLEEIASFGHGNSKKKCSENSTTEQETPAMATAQNMAETHLFRGNPSGPKEKKYGCDICGLHFARKFNLNVHIRGHDPKLARPFECPECPKSFGRKHDLSRHLATVHKGERPHQCPSCQKHFSRKDGLHRHLIKGCSNL